MAEVYPSLVGFSFGIYFPHVADIIWLHRDFLQILDTTSRTGRSDLDPIHTS